jgi:hypothetical protein
MARKATMATLPRTNRGRTLVRYADNGRAGGVRAERVVME